MWQYVAGTRFLGVEYCGIGFVVIWVYHLIYISNGHLIIQICQSGCYQPCAWLNCIFKYKARAKAKKADGFGRRDCPVLRSSVKPRNCWSSSNRDQENRLVIFPFLLVCSLAPNVVRSALFSKGLGISAVVFRKSRKWKASSPQNLKHLYLNHRSFWMI